MEVSYNATHVYVVQNDLRRFGVDRKFTMSTNKKFIELKKEKTNMLIS